MADRGSVITATREFIINQFLPGEDPADLTEDLELIGSGILDLARLKLVTHLEETYGIHIEAWEADEDNLNTLTDIASLVLSKS